MAPQRVVSEMRRIATLVVTALALGGAAHAQTAALPAGASPEQAAYYAAVTQARASLPLFWQRMMENPGGPGDYSLKVVFPSPGGAIEDIWLTDVKRDGDHVVGRLNYDPESMPNMHRGQTVPINQANIVDWSFKEGRKRYGEFTTRVLAKAHPEESAKTMALLSDNPLPYEARTH